MKEAAKGQAPDSPQYSPINSFFRKRISVLTTLMALGVASPGCSATQHTVENPTTNESEPEQEEETVTTDEEDSAQPEPEPKSESEPEAEEESVTTDEEDSAQPKPEAPNKEDERSMWDKIADKVKAKAFEEGVRGKCKEQGEALGEECFKLSMTAINEVREQCKGKTGILARACSKAVTVATDQAQGQCIEKGIILGTACSTTVMFTTNQACRQIDKLKLKPTVKTVCEDTTFKQFCEGKNEEVLSAFLAYCAEARAEKQD